MTKPEPLSVVHKHFEGRGSTIAEHEYAAAKRVLLQDFSANTSQAIDPAAEVGRLDGHQDPHLGRDLQHHSLPQKLRLNAARSGASIPLKWIRILAPATSSSSRMHSCAVIGTAPGSSTNLAPQAEDIIGEPETDFSSRRFCSE